MSTPRWKYKPRGAARSTGLSEDEYISLVPQDPYTKRKVTDVHTKASLIASRRWTGGRRKSRRKFRRQSRRTRLHKRKTRRH